jgi:hypothetical protein
VYLGSDGSWHIRKLEPRALRMIRKCRQRWHRLSGNGGGSVIGDAVYPIVARASPGW